MEDIVDNYKRRSPPVASIESSNHTSKSPAPAAPLAPERELPHHPASNSALAQASEKPKDSAAQPSSTEGQAPGLLRSEPSPTPASTTTTAPREPNGDSAPEPPSKQLNGRKTPFDDNEAESELSEPDSNVHSPLPVGLNELEEDEIVVGAKTNGRQKSSLVRVVSEDETMLDAQEEPVISHYPKRKRNSVFTDLSESKMELPGSGDATKSPATALATKSKAARHSLGGVKGVLLGQWRDSPVPEKEDRHAVIGFIDVRDRLRTRIQPVTVAGVPIGNEYPLPPGPGGSWVTFDRVIFSKHLVGLDHFHVKEYVRIRAEAHEENDEERRAAEKAAVKDAIRRVKENPLYDNPATQPAIAHGPDLPESIGSPGRDAKRRRVSSGFSAVNPNTNDHEQSPMPQPQPLQPRPTNSPNLRGPLPGTRPTRILLGYWKGSSEPELKDRHAVYGILGQNDMFRVKVVRETRDGRFVDGNFPSGAGALWIQYEEVEFEPHLQPLTRSEIKEYCRVRQYQIDHGEVPEERVANETTAVFEAQTRAGGGYRHVHQPIAPNYPAASEEDAAEQTNGKAESGQPEQRQSRRTEARAGPRQSLNENDLRPASRVYNDLEPRSESRAVSRPQNSEPIERAHALARREIARIEAAQGRADRHALHRERAAALTADAAAAAAAAAATPTPTTNGKSRFHESEDMQRLNKVWARQESSRMKAGAEDAKMYDGIKYERKTTGPFMGKLVSQGTIINIDGEDYVEYRVLTKPSFF